MRKAKPFQDQQRQANSANTALILRKNSSNVMAMAVSPLSPPVTSWHYKPPLTTAILLFLIIWKHTQVAALRCVRPRVCSNTTLFSVETLISLIKLQSHTKTFYSALKNSWCRIYFESIFTQKLLVSLTNNYKGPAITHWIYWQKYYFLL